MTRIYNRANNMTHAGDSKDYYAILDADESMPLSELERRYRRLAVERHPDRGGSEESMKALNEAYGVLKDRVSRNAFDQRQRPTTTVDHTDAFRPHSTPAAQADIVYGQIVRAIACLLVGAVLLFLVRFQWIWFLWPLGVLAVLVLFMGVLMAHSAMLTARDEYARNHPALRQTAIHEAIFWSAVCGGGYGMYLILSAV